MSPLRILALAAAFLFSTLSPALAGETVTYMDGDVKLEGYLARANAGVTGKPSPLVLIVHQWKGLGDYERMRADMLAKAGYNALAIDMYGQNIRPSMDQDAATESGKYKNDPVLARKRIQSALDYARTLKAIDLDNIAIIGYCFGGTMALEAARSGAPYKAAVSFHGGLASKAPLTQPGTIKASVQIHHGAADPYVPQDEVFAFMQEMNAGGADWHLTQYSGAVHAFTEKEAGTDPSKGVAYNQNADIRSWAGTLNFLAERLYPAQ